MVVILQRMQPEILLYSWLFSGRKSSSPKLPYEKSPSGLFFQPLHSAQPAFCSGTHFKPSGSGLSMQGGPRELHYRQHLLRVSQGFERNATVGFRRVRDWNWPQVSHKSTAGPQWTQRDFKNLWYLWPLTLAGRSVREGSRLDSSVKILCDPSCPWR